MMVRLILPNCCWQRALCPSFASFVLAPILGTLDIREIVHLDAFIRAGVRYFEFNSEPDQDSEWKGGRVPANGLDLVVENTIANIETILERGGMPAIPALSNGSRWDLVGGIVARGRKDLFNGPVWQAIHNYSRNRPLDYPYDIGSQEGAAYTQRFYEALVNEAWGEDPWRGRSLTDVNRLRIDRCSPGTTIMDDNACWLAYEYFDARNRRQLGQSIPILSTECGYLVGEDVDPAVSSDNTGSTHGPDAGSMSRHDGNEQSFCYGAGLFLLYGVLAARQCNAGQQQHMVRASSWYSDRWPGKSLPIVYALKAEPKTVRRWQDSAQIGVAHDLARYRATCR